MTIKTNSGRIKWFDLTVENADAVSKFYRETVGWEIMPISMGNYEDYCMNHPETQETVAGVCHSRGGNKDLPPTWLVYITVDNLTESLEKCKKAGGKVVGEIKKMGKSQFCLIQDPAGAYAMFFEENLD